jgi:hypothetical protein
VRFGATAERSKRSYMRPPRVGGRVFLPGWLRFSERKGEATGHGSMSNTNNEFEITEKTADAINSHFTFNTGPMRLLMIRSTLIFEIRNPGMRMTAKAPKATTILRREFGITGNPVKQLATFETILQMVEILEAWDITTATELNGKLRILTGKEAAAIKKSEGKAVVIAEDPSLN